MRALVREYCLATALAALLPFAVPNHVVAQERSKIETAFFLDDGRQSTDAANDIKLVSDETAAATQPAAAEPNDNQANNSEGELPVGTKEPAIVSEDCNGCGDPVCGCCLCCNPWYVSISGAWQQREQVHEVGDPLVFLDFNSGIAGNVALGARVDSFRFEFETSFMNSEVDRAGAAGLSSSAAGNVNLRAYMFNVYHDIAFKSSCWRPYVGAGVGIYQSEINSLMPGFFNTIGPPFSTTPVNCTSDMPFCYQLRAGVSRPIFSHTEFFTGYRYFRGEELEFASAPFAGPGAPTFHPNAAKVHAIEFGLRVNF